MKNILKKAGKVVLVIGGVAALVAGGLFAAQALASEEGESTTTEDVGTEDATGEVTGS